MVQKRNNTKSGVDIRKFMNTLNESLVKESIMRSSEIIEAKQKIYNVAFQGDEGDQLLASFADKQDASVFRYCLRLGEYLGSNASIESEFGVFPGLKSEKIIPAGTFAQYHNNDITAWKNIKRELSNNHNDDSVLDKFTWILQTIETVENESELFDLSADRLYAAQDAAEASKQAKMNSRK